MFWRSHLSEKAGVAVYLLVALGPTLWLALKLGRLTGPDLRNILADLFLNSRTLGLIQHSLGLSTLVTAGSLLLGLSSAIWIATRANWQGNLARKLYLIPFVIPGYIYTLTWLSLLSRSSVLAPRLEWFFGRLPSPYGLTGAAAIMSLAYAPLATLLTLSALEASEPELIEQALLFVPAERAWRRVILPLVGPATTAAAGLVFALTLVEYGVPALLEYNVYPMEIYAEFSQSGDPQRALLLALPVLIGATLLVSVSQQMLKRAPLSSRPQGEMLLKRLPLPVPENALAWLAMLSLAVSSLFPVLVLIIQTSSPKVIIVVASQAGSDLLTTLLLAVSAALGATMLALIPARQLAASETSPWLWTFLLLPLAIPAPLVGIGLIDLSNQLPMRISGAGLLWFAHVERFMPLALVALTVQFRRADPLLHEMARLYQVGWLRRAWQIDLPLLAGGLSTALAIVFVLSLGEIGATLLVIPPGLGTAALRLYTLLHYGAPASTAALALILLIIILIAGGVWVSLQNKHTSGMEP